MKSFLFLYVFEATDRAVCVRTVVLHLDSAWRHLSFSGKFNAKLKLFPPIYLEIPCGHRTTQNARFNMCTTQKSVVCPLLRHLRPLVEGAAGLCCLADLLGRSMLSWSMLEQAGAC